MRIFKFYKKRLFYINDILCNQCLLQVRACTSYRNAILILIIATINKVVFLDLHGRTLLLPKQYKTVCK